eukprot:172294_1
MMPALLSILLFFTLTSCQDIILTPNNTNAYGTPIGLIYIPTADILPHQYISICELIQSSFLQPLYVVIPQFIDNIATYDEFLLLLPRLIQQMEHKGLRKNASIFFAGHGLGGNILQTFSGINQFNYSQIHPFTYKGQILHAAFITRTWRDNNTQLLSNYTIPTLTISGELDGIIRISRIIEQYYIQQISNSTDHNAFVNNKTLLNYPVIIINGMNHKQYFTDNIPAFILDTDLISEIKDSEAQKIVAQYTACWMSLKLNNNACSFDTIYDAINKSNILAKPFITAYKLEGSYWFKRPCDCEELLCPSQWNCNGGSPWMILPQQIMCGFGIYGNESIKVSVNNTDAFHPTYQVNPIVYANIWNNCSSPYDINCVLNTSTVTQNKYPIEDTEIDDIGDTGTYSTSAFEMRHKMKSRQACYEHVNAGYVEEDFEICGKINQYSVNWGLDNAPVGIINRFMMYGEELRIGADQHVVTGNEWTWDALNYTQECDNKTHTYFTAVNSEYIYLETVKNGCKFVEVQCGVHYCKVLSPAHYLEWMYTDGLRFNLTLANANTTVNTTC